MQTQNRLCLFNVTKIADGKRVSLLQAHLLHIQEKPETPQRFLHPSSFPCAPRSNIPSLILAGLRKKSLLLQAPRPRSFLEEKCRKVSL